MAKQTVELTIPGSFKGEPIFFYMVKNYDVIPNIIEASFEALVDAITYKLLRENAHV